MYLKVNAKIAALLLDHEGLNNYTTDGLAAILDIENDCEEKEFYPLDFSSRWVEYGQHVPLSIHDLVEEYDYLLSDNFEDYEDYDDFVEALIDELSRRTVVITLKTGNVIIAEF